MNLYAKRYKRASLVAIGGTTTPEIGNNASTEPLATRPTRNPWNIERSAGGSSGGAAAAVAAGIAPLGHAAVGHLGDEETLFSLSAQLERARPWAHRRPGVHVAGQGAHRAV